MLRNYLTIAWRNLIRHKVFSLINVIGLATGMTVCLLIFLYVHDELSFDRYHPQADLIYRLTTRFKTAGSDDGTAGSGVEVGPWLQRTYPEVKEVVRFKSLPAVTIRQHGQLFKETDIYQVDSHVFRMFSYPMLQGDPSKALKGPNSIVLTKKLAEKYFGKDWETRNSSLGKIITLNDQPYQVTGVIEDLPTRTDLKFTALLSWHLTKAELEDWMDPSYYTFLKFDSPEKALSFPQKLAQFDEKQYGQRVNELAGFDLKLVHELQSLTEVHFQQGLYDDTPKGNRTHLRVFSIIAVFILLVACINYVNLYLAQSTRRQKEVGIRKVVGAGRKQLLFQFVGEAVLLTMVSVLLTLTLVQLLMPAFNQFTGKTFTLLTIPDWQTLALGMLFVLLVSLMAGCYPAFYLSAAEPARVLKGRWVSSGKQLLRKGLVVTQFTISSALIVGTGVVYWQMQYLRTKHLGFDHEQVLVVEIPDDEAIRQTIPQLKTKLSQNSRVKGVSIGPKPVAFDGKASFTRTVDGQSVDQMVNFANIDENYLSVLKIKLAAGRNFSGNIPSDPDKAVIVNEAFVKWMGWKDAIGQEINPSHDPAQIKRVIGVVKDFHYVSLHNPIEPILLYYNTGNMPTLLMNIQPGELETVRSAWTAMIPNRTFEYSFLDADFNEQYRQEEKMMTILGWFSVLTIGIACLGLFGLASFITLQRTKEVGIRKVLGASIAQILIMLSKDFIRLVLLANLLALPLAYWATSQWLTNYAFRIDPNPWLFLSPALLVLLIAILTLSFQTWKAARQNPVKALRYE
jgi:putative ABC transport system permease protein